MASGVPGCSRKGATGRTLGSVGAGGAGWEEGGAVSRLQRESEPGVQSCYFPSHLSVLTGTRENPGAVSTTLPPPGRLHTRQGARALCSMLPLVPSQQPGLHREVTQRNVCAMCWVLGTASLHGTGESRGDQAKKYPSSWGTATVFPVCFSEGALGFIPVEFSSLMLCRGRGRCSRRGCRAPEGQSGAVRSNPTPIYYRPTQICYC